MTTVIVVASVPRPSLLHEQLIKEMLRKARQQQQTTERQSNTTQLVKKKTQRKIGCLGWELEPTTISSLGDALTN